MRLDPLLTCAPAAWAIRPVTEALLRETFLAPLPVAFPCARCWRAAPRPGPTASPPRRRRPL